MLVTNDVALITFVPFTFIVLGMIGQKAKRQLVVPVVVLQTIAANLGGLGTLIASMASLISYKLIAREGNQAKGIYFRYFMVENSCFLIALLMFELFVRGQS